MNVETRADAAPLGGRVDPERAAAPEVDGSLAVHYAERALEGRALEVRLHRRGTRPVFQVLVQQPAGPARVEVDAATGRILDLGPLAGPAANDPSHG